MFIELLPPYLFSPSSPPSVKDKNNQICDTDLKYLENFPQLVKQKYKIQVEQDHTNLSVGLKIAEDLINTIRGIIEIEQTKRDPLMVSRRLRK